MSNAIETRLTELGLTLPGCASTRSKLCALCSDRQHALCVRPDQHERRRVYHRKGGRRPERGRGRRSGQKPVL